MGLQTKNTQADKAREVLLETLRRFIQEGPSAKELAAAKKNITGGFPLRIAGNAKVVEYLAMIGFYGLPLDYLDRFTDAGRGGDRRADPRRLRPAHPPGAPGGDQRGARPRGPGREG